MAESVLSLIVAVILFRTFLVEGYMISTGSMAPTLLGFHKRVVCPTCGFPFRYGVRWDDDPHISADDADIAGSPSVEPLCVCPNCGQNRIDISRVPRNQGDQLLVHKDVFALRPPRRWEVVVFRNPYEPTQAYVKRVAGLPGETITIHNGDVYANGTLCRKPLRSQRAVRISVFDNRYRPTDDPNWQPRWMPEPDWRPEGAVFQSVPTEAWSWVTYHHWLRSGGTHETSVSVPVTQSGLNVGDDFLPVHFDAKTRRLICVGAMSDAIRDGLLTVSREPVFQTAVMELYHRSHVAPVTDVYGYNPPERRSQQLPVRDLMFAATVSLPQPAAGRIGEFAVEMTDGYRTWRVVLDVSIREAQLWEVDPPDGDTPRLLRKTYLPAGRFAKPVLIEMSLVDRQVSVALDGQPPFEPWLIEEPLPTGEPPRQPVRFGARGLSAQVTDVCLYRDVYYTSRTSDGPCRLSEDEYFMLGDNSPVSLDSRRWPQGAVPARLFLGKPFVVHLPSRQMKLRLGGETRYIRVPDFAEIRYIR